MYFFLKILPYITLCLGLLAMFIVYSENKNDSLKRSTKK